MKQYEVLTIDEFRALLGVPDGKLERFADFNKHCLKPALDEVNHLTDFVVEVMLIKNGRTVEKLQLNWYKKTREQLQRPMTSARKAVSAGRPDGTAAWKSSA